MAEYTGFTDQLRDTIRDTNLPEAKRMCDRVLAATNQHAIEAALRSIDRQTLQPKIDWVRTLLFNIFSILMDADMDPRASIDQQRLNTLRSNFQKVRNGFDVLFPKLYHDDPNQALAAWTSRDFSDTTVNLSPKYLELSPEDQAVTLVHERAHTLLRISGHPGTGDSPVCIRPHEGVKGLGFDQAIRNAYCYEWIATSLQANYNPRNPAYTDACTIHP